MYLRWQSKTLCETRVLLENPLSEWRFVLCLVPERLAVLLTNPKLETGELLLEKLIHPQSKDPLQGFLTGV